MAYVIAIGIIVLIVYGIAKAVGGRHYSEMTEEEFEAEAKKGSPMGAAVSGLQKIIAPAHSAEYIQQEQQRIEAESTNSGDRPKAGSPPPANEREEPSARPGTLRQTIGVSSDGWKPGVSRCAPPDSRTTISSSQRRP